MAGDYVNEFAGTTGDTTAANGPWENLAQAQEYALGRLRDITDEPCPEWKGLRCKLNDKICVRSHGHTCPYYEAYLQELKEEKENELKEAEELEEKEDLINGVKNESYYQ